VVAGSVGCGLGASKEAQPTHSSPTTDFSANFARQWMTNLANSVKGDTVAPPVATRAYAYGAIAMYEAVVHGMPGHQSLAGQLNGLDSLPAPNPALEYDWPTVLAETMHQMMLASLPPPGAPGQGAYTYPNRIFYEYTTPTQVSLTMLGPTQIGLRRTEGVPDQVIENSIAFGDELAAALIEWARADAYHDVRFSGWIAPTGPDKWVPAGFADTDKIAIPVEPHFGTVRPLVMTTPDECSPANLGLAPPPFSTDPESEFYQAALHVYNTSLELTNEQRIIARMWEDNPGATSTPPGHWVAITTKLVRNLDLGAAVKAYAWISIGFLDSFIGVWQEKYVSNLLRPTTYIRRHIDPGWFTLLGTPQFPTYVSGHSGQSGASGRLLTAMFGDIPFVDDTKVRRGFAPRSFASFDEAAEEAAVSRLYGGIHYVFDNDDGLALGRCVAAKIIERVSLEQ
jgi:hypothetical protein